MAGESRAPVDLTVSPSEAEVRTFEKLIDVLDAYKKTDVVRAAIKLGVFKALRASKLSAEEVARRCNVHESRRVDALLDILCVEEFLVREKQADGTVLYGNSEGAERLLADESSPSHFTALDMLLKFRDQERDRWVYLGESLQAAPGEEKGVSVDSHEEKQPDCHAEESKEDWSTDPEQVRKSGELYKTFEGYMRINFNLLAERFDFSKCKRVLDIGGGSTQLSRILCRRYKHLECISLDLPRAQAFAESWLKEVGADVADRITLKAGNCLKDDLPTPVDVAVIANVLHGFDNVEEQTQVIKRAFDALSPGGSLIVLEMFIDHEKKYGNGIYTNLSAQVKPVMDGSRIKIPVTFTTDSFKSLCEVAGFRMADHIELAAGSVTAVVAVKPE